MVTGLGMITPLGSTVEKTWDGILAGKSGIGPITRFDATGLETTIAGEVRDFDPQDYMDRKEIRRSDRFVHFAVAAAGQALKSARLEITPELAPRIGVAFGSGIGGVETLVDQVLVHQKDPRRVSPFLIPMMIIDMAAGEIAMKYRAKGPNMGHVSACASSANAIGEAAEIIRRGQADVMLAGGSEAGLIKIAIGAFNQARALSTRNNAPEKASRPFDKDRDGFVMGEGGAILILEVLDRALARGAHVYAEVVGYGTSNDAHHMTAPRPDGSQAARSMRLALRDAELAPHEVAYVNAHGSSTPLNDPTETLAVKATFGDHAPRLQLSSTKAYYGHALGASGAMELAITALALEQRWLPPTLNLDSPDPVCDLDYIPKVGRDADVEYALSNSFGFGGINAAVVLKRHDGV